MHPIDVPYYISKIHRLFRIEQRIDRSRSLTDWVTLEHSAPWAPEVGTAFNRVGLSRTGQAKWQHYWSLLRICFARFWEEEDIDLTKAERSPSNRRLTFVELSNIDYCQFPTYIFFLIVYQTNRSYFLCVLTLNYLSPCKYSEGFLEPSSDKSIQINNFMIR